MINISPFGAFHTAIAMVAVAAGIVALLDKGTIGSRTQAGLWYIVLTVATCLTGLMIFRHGNFGPPHMLAILTLIVLAVAWIAERRSGFGRLSEYVATLGYSLSLFFHLIPGLTETGTRVPPASPLFSGPEDPLLQALVGAGFVVYLIGAAWQVSRIRARRRASAAR